MNRNDNVQKQTKPLITTKQAACRLGVSVKQIEKWRYEGGGPKYIKLGKRSVRYEQEEIENYIVARTFKNSAEEKIKNK